MILLFVVAFFTTFVSASPEYSLVKANQVKLYQAENFLDDTFISDPFVSFTEFNFRNFNNAMKAHQILDLIRRIVSLVNTEVNRKLVESISGIHKKLFPSFEGFYKIFRHETEIGKRLIKVASPVDCYSEILAESYSSYEKAKEAIAYLAYYKGLYKQITLPPFMDLKSALERFKNAVDEVIYSVEVEIGKHTPTTQPQTSVLSPLYSAPRKTVPVDLTTLKEVKVLCLKLIDEIHLRIKVLENADQAWERLFSYFGIDLLDDQVVSEMQTKLEKQSPSELIDFMSHLHMETSDSNTQLDIMRGVTSIHRTFHEK